MIVVDSSFLVAIHSAEDASHKQAVEIAKKVDPATVVLLPAEVFSETINTLWHKVSKSTAVKTVKEILSREEYSVPETTKEIHQIALEKFERQPNSVSFTDCLVMAFTDHFKTKTILGFDESFSKSGYSLPS